MDSFRYINNSSEDLKVDGFLVKAHDQLISSIEIPALSDLVDYENLVGLKNGQRLDHVVPEVAEFTPSIDIELHETSTETVETPDVVPEEDTVKEA
jgi:hypothetical protein